ncbi:MAG: DUF262 domain-containing HNH endonuclease family protein [Desulfobacca sp.]|nr:DUF262 domain-containing HNH endonuclease family protein [Desulfobacca sp.]
MGPVTIQGSEKPVAKIFSDDFVFNVPNYQRPYAWTTEESGELLDDLLVSLDNGKSPVENLNPYFLGSIVLIKGEKPDSQIVDGQQRLVTLTILLSVIRSLLGQDKAEGISVMIYEKGNPILFTPDRYRLTIRKRDENFFQEYIQVEGGIEKLKSLNGELPESCKNIRNNALNFVSKLENLSETELIYLASFIALRCFVVVVSTPDLNSAYRIFSVLNDRGLDLSLTDILKAEVIGEVGAKEEEEYTKKWEDIEDNLGRDAFEDLFAHIRMIKAKNKLRSTVLQEFRSYLNPTNNPKEFIDNTLLPMGEIFDQIQNTSYEGVTKTDEINGFLKYLKRIDNFDWQPSSILYMTYFRNKPEQLLRFLTKLERLAVGMMILRADINYRIERYGRVLAAIESNADLLSAESPIQLSDEERKRIITTLDGDIYTVVKIRLPILLRLDEALSGGEATYNYPILTVEHVLPQCPPADSKWLEWWPNEDERNSSVHRLGNLALLSRRKNSKASNFEFERKKKEYFQRGGVSPFTLTTQVLQEPEWTPATVAKRQNNLLETLKKVWDL